MVIRPLDFRIENASKTFHMETVEKRKKMPFTITNAEINKANIAHFSCGSIQVSYETIFDDKFNVPASKV